jgi:hypothetical protein
MLIDLTLYILLTSQAIFLSWLLVTDGSVAVTGIPFRLRRLGRNHRNYGDYGALNSGVVGLGVLCCLVR